MGQSLHQTYWGLGGTPFRGRPDHRFYYQGLTHEEAFARLHFLVDQRRRLGVLFGPPGSGKSFLLDVFAQRMRGQGRPVARVNLTGVGPGEFLWLLAAELGVNLDPDLPTRRLWIRLGERFREYRYQRMGAVILLDDADAASEEVRTQLVRLVRAESDPESSVSVVVASRPEQAVRLGSALLELAELRIDLEPWDETETAGFLSASLEAAGRGEPVFEPEAVVRIHQLGEGVPRRVSQLADLALLAGAGQDLERVDAGTVDSVYRELGVVET